MANHWVVMKAGLYAELEGNSSFCYKMPSLTIDEQIGLFDRMTISLFLFDSLNYVVWIKRRHLAHHCLVIPRNIRCSIPLDLVGRDYSRQKSWKEN